MSLDDGVRLALESLASVNDDELRPEGIGVATIDTETEMFHELTEEEREGYLEEFELLAPEEDETEDDDAEDEA
jgi:proteasome alpha subunit